jgi:hypothetical protein
VCGQIATFVRSSAWWLSLELNIAFLGDRSLLDCDHLSLHVGKFGSSLLVATNEERGRPEDDDSGCGHQLVFRSLAVLRTLAQKKVMALRSALPSM